MPDGSTQYYTENGAFNGANYPDYHRLDLTLNRHFYTSRGRISAFLSVINVYNHRNVRNINYEWRLDEASGRPLPQHYNDYWFRLLPSIGVSWSWEH
jgi:hypothetical protein